MSVTRRTGRPLRALAILAALIVGWIAGRWPSLERDVAAAVAQAEREQVADFRPEQVSRKANAVGRPAAAIRVAAPAQTTSMKVGPSPPLGQRLMFVGLSTRISPRLRGDHDVRFRLTPAKLGRAATEIRSGPEVRVAAPALAAKGSLATSVAAIPAAPSSIPFDLATRAYAALAAGDRRAAARDFDAALAADSAAPQAPAWAHARRALTKRWSGSAYVFARPGAASGAASLDTGGAAVANAPLLGGSQSGAALAYALDPLARRPFDLIARATGSSSLDQRQAEAALGVRWRLLPGASFSAERLIALGAGGRRDWTLRLAGGREARIGPVAVDGYGETGVVGIAHPTLFAAGQVRGGVPIAIAPAFTIMPGAGVWAGIQRDRPTTTDRVDAGPSLRLRWARATLPVNIAVDYRRHVAGNAAPGSGAAMTLSTGF